MENNKFVALVAVAVFARREKTMITGQSCRGLREHKHKENKTIHEVLQSLLPVRRRYNRKKKRLSRCRAKRRDTHFRSSVSIARRDSRARLRRLSCLSRMSTRVRAVIARGPPRPPEHTGRATAAAAAPRHPPLFDTLSSVSALIAFS